MGVRDRVREFIEAMVEAELEAALSRPRHAAAASDRTRRRAAHSVSCATVMATGRARYWGLSARSRLRCRARLNTPEGKTTEWKSRALKRTR